MVYLVRHPLSHSGQPDTLQKPPRKGMKGEALCHLPASTVQRLTSYGDGDATHPSWLTTMDGSFLHEIVQPSLKLHQC